MIGVVSLLISGVLPKLSPRHVHAIRRLPTFWAVIWSRGEYRVLPASPPIRRHSPFAAPCCAARATASSNGAPRTAVVTHNQCRGLHFEFCILHYRLLSWRRLAQILLRLRLALERRDLVGIDS